jgi:HSP20 family protein
MTRLVRWNPYREMSELINAVDRLVDSRSMMPRMAWRTSSDWDWNIALDVSEDEDQYVVKASLPGINPDDLDISIESNMITIKGEVKEESESDSRRYHLRERRFGSFCRSFSLPNSVDADSIDATYEDGVLTLSLPKVEEAKAKRIEVKSGTPLIKDKN